MPQAGPGHLTWTKFAACLKRPLVIFTATLAIAAFGTSFYLILNSDQLSNDSIFTEIEKAKLPPTGSLNPGYLGPGACTECHKKKTETFQSTRHFVACCEPNPGKMPKGFEPTLGTVICPDPNVSFEMKREGNDFFQITRRKSSNGTEEFRNKIGLIYGSGGTGDEVYHLWQGNRLQESRVGWLVSKSQWGLSNLDTRAPGDLSRETTVRCLECHNTWIDHVPGTSNTYRKEAMILGVTCENCHGPAKDHVAHHRANPDDQEGRSIIKPSSLPRDRQIDLCAQCHSNAPRDKGPAFSFRAGDPLEKHFRTNLNSKYWEDDHVANQTKYMSLSKCFIKSEKMTCVTCHETHRPEEKETVRKSCTKCHQPSDCQERDRLPEAIRSDCVSCHMPQRVWMNVHFHLQGDLYSPPIRRFDHKIGIYPEAAKEKVMNWHLSDTDPAGQQKATQIRSDLVNYWLAEAEKRKKEFRFLGAIAANREAIRLDPSPKIQEKLDESIQNLAKIDQLWIKALAQIDQKSYPEAIQSMNDILALKPDLAKVHGKLGFLHSITGQKNEATRHLLAVSEHDPDDAYGLNLLGWLAHLEGSYQKAIDYYTQAELLLPYASQLPFRKGLSLLGMGKNAEARDEFKKTVLIDPRNAAAYNGLATSLVRLGFEPKECLEIAKIAANLSKVNDPEILLTLADTCALNGRLDHAAQVAHKGLSIVSRANVSLISEFKSRLAKWDPK